MRCGPAGNKRLEWHLAARQMQTCYCAAHGPERRITHCTLGTGAGKTLAHVKTRKKGRVRVGPWSADCAASAAAGTLARPRPPMFGACSHRVECCAGASAAATRPCKIRYDVSYMAPARDLLAAREKFETRALSRNKCSTYIESERMWSRALSGTPVGNPWTVNSPGAKPACVRMSATQSAECMLQGSFMYSACEQECNCG